MVPIIQCMFIICLLFLLPGCTSIIRWGKKEFPQIKKICFDANSIAAYLQTLLVYQQFSLALTCDVLLLSKTVLDIYADFYLRRISATEEERERLIASQLDQYKKMITFIFLLPYQVTFNKKSEWRVTLFTHNAWLKPISIEPIIISPEYALLFGEKHSRLKYAYRITFEKPVEFDETSIMTLCFKNAFGESFISFPKSESINDNCNRC